MSLTPNMVQCVDFSRMQEFQCHLRPPEMVQRGEAGTKRRVSAKLEASGIGRTPPQQNTIEKEGPELCAVVSPDVF